MSSFPALLSGIAPEQSHSHDFSSGEIRAHGGFLETLLIAGDLTLGPTGVIRTAESGKRVELTGLSGDRINLWAGNGTDGEKPAMIFASDERLFIQSPSDTAHPAYASLYLDWGTAWGLQNALILGHLLPGSDNTYDIGSAAFGMPTWRNVYAYAVYDEDGNLRLDLSTVSYGVNDSGGAGFKLVRVPN